jgi:uncharacterized protein YoxC
MGWTDVVTAISTSILATLAVGLMVAFILWLREARRLMGSVERVVNSLDRDARPALESARGIIDDAGKVMTTIREEVDGFADVSRDVRDRVGDLAESVEARLEDLETVVDVLHEEIEETALDVAAALRATRRGASVVRAVKRAFLGRGR